jgi:hypothetical protein
MKLISTIDDLKANLNTLESYLSTSSEREAYAKQLLHRGSCFVAYSIAGELRFAPSRFVGYRSNSYNKHIKSIEKDGRVTNDAIRNLLDAKPLPNPKLEETYFSYCNSLGVYPKRREKDGRQRKFWLLDLGDEDFANNKYESGEFSEGKIVERAHKSRERNSKVIQIAKQNFKLKHGSLFCEVCEFDFEKHYGVLGKDFIEGHHTIPVSAMEPDYKTKPEEIAMVCSNCHRMLHRSKEWLKIDELKALMV